MIKKILITLLILFTSFLVQGQITLTTISNNDSWEPNDVVNTGGDTLQWVAENSKIGTIIKDEDWPVFDFSANDGSPIDIVITNSNDFLNLSVIRFKNKEVTNVDLTKATELIDVRIDGNNISTIDLSSQTKAQTIWINENNLSSLDLSKNAALISCWIDYNNISTFDISNNYQLHRLYANNNKLPSLVLNELVNQLDKNGLVKDAARKHFEIKLADNEGALTREAQSAYDNLIAKGWSFLDATRPLGYSNSSDINIKGLGHSIPNNGTNIPGTYVENEVNLDGTDFGIISSGTSIIKTFTIENLGDQDLNLILPIEISGVNSYDFIITKLPATTLALGGNTTFEVTFNANSLGTKTAQITINSNDPDESAYLFNVLAEVSQAAPGPEIDVTGNGVSIPSGNAPVVTDNTDFGQVAIGSPVTHTFTISNIGDSDLTINYFFTATSNYFSFLPSGGGSIVLSSGASTTIDATFDPEVLGSQTGTITIDSTDPDEGTYVINLSAEGIPATNGTIDVQGNGQSIANGDLVPDIADDTDFGQVKNNTSKTNTYTIFNNHLTDNLTITDIILNFGSDTEFMIDNESEILPFDLIPGASMTFDVIFIPTVSGNYNANVEVVNSDTDTGSPFQFAVTGEGADVVVGGDIMITQYYDNTAGDNWIEIKNISGATISAGTYFLALYDQDAIPTITSQAPTASESIPELAADEVLLFSNVGATLPTSSNLGSVTIITTAVCNFNGNDVILISTSINTTCYADRQDIVGEVPAAAWGADISLIRGGSSSETPEAFFDKNNWIILSPSTDVDVASTNTNIALGIQGLGSTIWDGASWSNFDPDKTRTVEISGTYDASIGNIEAYNLIVNTGNTLNFDSGTTNSVIIDGNLTINGVFIIGDQESLVMYNDDAEITGNITKIENSTFRNNTHDFTYWSSPIVSGAIETAFPGVTPSRIFHYDQTQSSSSDPLDPTYWDTWIVATGLMTPGKGYAAEGPTGDTGVHNISFTGVPNNGLVEFDVFENNDGDSDNDFNLIGNPYPSAIDIDEFFAANSLVDPTIYLWTHNTPISGGDSGDFISSDYATYNLSGGVGSGTNPNGTIIPDNNVGSSQGFFMRASNSGLVVFNNKMRMVDANNQFFKSNNSKNKSIEDEKDRVWLNLTTDKGGFNQLLIAFMDKATEGVDRGYDALKFEGDNPIAFYSVIEDAKYTIQGLHTFSEDKTINLGFDTSVYSSTFTISIDRIEGVLKDSEIYLIDNLLNITHNLKESDYQFEITEIVKTIKISRVTTKKGFHYESEQKNMTIENMDRFTLQFAGQALDVDDNILAENNFIVSNDFGILKIRASKTVNLIKVYDILGRMLINETPNEKSFELKTGSIKAGTVLIIESTFDNGAILSKKAIKY